MRINLALGPCTSSSWLDFSIPCACGPTQSSGVSASITGPHIKLHTTSYDLFLGGRLQARVRAAVALHHVEQWKARKQDANKEGFGTTKLATTPLSADMSRRTSIHSAPHAATNASSYIPRGRPCRLHILVLAKACNFMQLAGPFHCTAASGDTRREPMRHGCVERCPSAPPFVSSVRISP